MKDVECVELLRWILPRLELRWAGFRRVRRQVCKRFGRRLAELGLERAADYRRYLTEHPEEWAVAAILCTVTISRFYRDKGVFAFLGGTVLPALGDEAIAADRRTLRAWSAGCGSGEEPYTLALVWRFDVHDRLPGLDLEILATDVDERLLKRAEQARYSYGCLKDLPEAWRKAAFEETTAGYRLDKRYKRGIRFERHDIREGPADGPFDIVLCRNLAFTYFEHGAQLATAQRLHDALTAGGALVLGRHETLPAATVGFTAWNAALNVYRKSC